LSRAERALLLAYGLVVAVGALIGFFTLYNQFVAAEGISVYRGWLGIGGMIGALLGVRLSRDGFGHEGTRGALRAVFASCVATGLTGVIGGTIALPILGTMFGPWLLVVSFAQGPALLLLWLIALLVVQRAYGLLRDERDSIFSG
jgi:hypothetical protein